MLVSEVLAVSLHRFPAAGHLNGSKAPALALSALSTRLMALAIAYHLLPPASLVVTVAYPQIVQSGWGGEGLVGCAWVYCHGLCQSAIT